MSGIAKIQQYIDRTKIKSKFADTYCLHLSEMSAFHDILRQNEFRAVSMIFAFGQAKGYRAAKAEVKR